MSIDAAGARQATEDISLKIKFRQSSTVLSAERLSYAALPKKCTKDQFPSINYGSVSSAGELGHFLRARIPEKPS